MKKIFAVVLILASLNFAQGVDLPDFVVSGTENVTLPVIKKNKPKLVLPLGNAFFMHKFSPEDFSVSYIAESDTNYIHPFKRNKNYRQYAKITSGFNVLPAANVFWGFPLNNGYLDFKFKGENRLNYIPFAGQTNFTGGVNLMLYTNYNADKLPRSYFDINANGNFSDYRFYGSITPSLRRKVSFGNAGVTFHHFTGDKLNLTAGVSGEDFRLLKENFTEQNVRASLGIKKKFSAFTLIGKGRFVNQKLKHNNYKVYNFVELLLAGQFNPYDNFAVSVGADVAHSGGRNSFAPYLKGKVTLAENLVFTGSWSSNANYFTNSDVVKLNPYYSLSAFTNIFSVVYNKIYFDFFYGFRDYFDVSFGFGFQKTDGFLYFESAADNIYFIPKTLDAVNGFISKLAVNFYFSRFGYLSGVLNIDREVNVANKLMPYSPIFKGQLLYNYKTPFSFWLTFGTEFYSRSYTNLKNSSSVPPYINLFLSSDYKLAKNLKLIFTINNILNRDNYLYRGYKEMPMDLQAGIEYFWR